MRVMFYESTVEWSGRARAFHDAARALAARGYDVLVAGSAGSRLEALARSTGLPVTTIPTEVRTVARARALRATLQEHYVDVVFVHGEREHLTVAVAARTAGRAAIVRRVEAGGTPALGMRARLATRLAPVTWLLTDTHGGEPGTIPARQAVVRGALGVRLPDDSPDFTARGEPPRLACLAERQARHRVSQVLRTLALLLERHPALTLAMAGTAAVLDELRLHAAALGVAGRLTWCGDDGERDALRGARGAWIIADSDTAAFGCLDAMAGGVPVFAERSPVTTGLLTEGIEGELFATLEPAELAAAASDYLLNDARRSSAGQAGRLRVERQYSERELANGFEHAVRVAREIEKGGDHG